MREFALEQVNQLLTKLAFAAGSCVRSHDADSVHDLRVAIRRLTEALLEFSQFLPRKGLKKVRRRMRKVMDLAAEARNRDVSLKLFEEAGVEPGKPPSEGLAADRKAARRQLVDALKRWQRRDFWARWRDQLGLGA
jgi:CHAD domain-containing protein